MTSQEDRAENVVDVIDDELGVVDWHHSDLLHIEFYTSGNPGADIVVAGGAYRGGVESDLEGDFYGYALDENDEEVYWFMVKREWAEAMNTDRISEDEYLDRIADTVRWGGRRWNYAPVLAPPTLGSDVDSLVPPRLGMSAGQIGSKVGRVAALLGSVVDVVLTGRPCRSRWSSIVGPDRQGRGGEAPIATSTGRRGPGDRTQSRALPCPRRPKRPTSGGIYVVGPQRVTRYSSTSSGHSAPSSM